VLELNMLDGYRETCCSPYLCHYVMNKGFQRMMSIF